MKDIADDLRNAIIRQDSNPWDEALYIRAADEIERLRSLITEWADADDGDLPFNDKYHECTCDKRFCLAARSLRKAVGR
jgi:predicted RNA-binding protein (virulence factor B family)